MDKALNYLGIARKAGLLIAGEEASGAAIRAGRAKILVLASDASGNASRRAEGFLTGRKIPLVRVPYTKEEIGVATGSGQCSMAAVTDVGLASSFMQALSEEKQEYSDVAEQLRLKNEKALLRKREAKAHDRNKRTGKGRMKV
jgi:ribosomal protein L7Ae-like RNA K-turn-binding protein